MVVEQGGNKRNDQQEPKRPIYEGTWFRRGVGALGILGGGITGLLEVSGRIPGGAPNAVSIGLVLLGIYSFVTAGQDRRVH